MTLGVCPGTATWGATLVSTRNASNICTATDGVRINEVESSGDTNDWIELYNAGPAAVDISGWILRDNKDTDALPIPASTTLASGSYFTMNTDDAANTGAANFGLGNPDSARLFLADGTTLVDHYEWSVHATTTYGRCPNGTGPFVTTVASSKGGANACPPSGVVVPDGGPAVRADAAVWPGGTTVTTVDNTLTFNQDASGLVYDPTDPSVLWVAQNKKGTLWKLRWDATTSTYLPDSTWGQGRDPHFSNGAGHPDTEGLTVGPDHMIYVTSERDNDSSNLSRLTVLQIDPALGDSSTGVTASAEWNLQSSFPQVSLSSSADANLGFEGITWVPDSYLVASGFRTSTGALYNPAEYPGHGTGLYVVALEKDGSLTAFALQNNGNGGLQQSTLVASAPSGFSTIMDVSWDPDLQALRAVCDNTCAGQQSLLQVGAGGTFQVQAVYARPTGLGNYNNEGFAAAPSSTCASGVKRAVWADDGDDDTFSLRAGTMNCVFPQSIAFVSTPTNAVAGSAYTPAVTATGLSASDAAVVSSTTPAVCTVTSGVVRLVEAGTCAIRADKAATIAYSAASATQSFAVSAAPVVAATITAGAPTIEGEPKVGGRLAVVPGTWGPAGVSLTYQWLADGAPIAGETGATLKLGKRDKGDAISVTVTASLAGATPVSKTTASVTVLKALTKTPKPSIAGTKKVGRTLSVRTGTWKPAPVKLRYQWLRDGVEIGKATGRSYTITKADSGSRITVAVTGSKKGYLTETETDTVKVKKQGR